MVSQLLFGLSLLGAGWVLWILLALSILSVTLMVERALFFKKASRSAHALSQEIRHALEQNDLEKARKLAQSHEQASSYPALLTSALLGARGAPLDHHAASEFARDVLLRARPEWERGLSSLATIGSNAPFIGLFGTVLGIIQAFHDLSQGAGGAATSAVTAGLADALVATAVGLLVAIPASIAYNLFQKKVRIQMSQAEGLAHFIVGHVTVMKGNS